MPKQAKKRTYHGWILVEKQGNGLRDVVTVEWSEGDTRKVYGDNWYGENGCARAVEWWDKKVGSGIKLEPTLRGCYRVYTEGDDHANHS